MAKNKSAALFYFLTIASGGIFAFFWLYLLMRDVDAILRLRRLRTVIIPMALGASYIGMAVFFVLGNNSTATQAISLDDVGGILGVLTLLLLLVGVVVTYKDILFLQSKAFGILEAPFIIVCTVFLAFFHSLTCSLFLTSKRIFGQPRVLRPFRPRLGPSLSSLPQS